MSAWRRWMARISSDTVDADGVPQTETNSVVRKGLVVLLAGLGVLLLWVLFAPLDEGVPANGTFMVDTKRKVVQHPQGGVIRQIAVREGQVVAAGEILVTLDDVQVRAEHEISRRRYLAAWAAESRLLAEQRGLSELVFGEPALLQGTDPQLEESKLVQQALFRNRRGALRSELAAIDEALRGHRESLAGNQQQIELRQQQHRLLVEERDGTRELAREGYAPRNKVLELERLVGEAETRLAELRAEAARTRSSAAELSMRRVQREQDYAKEVASELAAVRTELSVEAERLTATREQLERLQIKAPVGGAVVGIATQTIGGVIPPGARIMDVVPLDESLTFEAQVPPSLVHRVATGQSASIRFSTFSESPMLVVDGKVVSLSADLLVDPVTNISYYLARVQVTPEGQKALGSHRLQPGMPAEIVIKTGERSLFAYMLHPLVRRFSKAMTEQ